MNDNTILAAIVSTVALVIIISFLYYCLHDRIKALEERAGISTTHYHRFASIERIVKIIAVVAIVFCLFPSIHYLSTSFPRLNNLNDNLTFIQRYGIDYWGIIVGFLTLMVTLLVAWNIYSTLRAKDDLAAHRKKLDKQYKSAKKKLEALPNEKFKSLENSINIMSKCCTERKEEISQLKAYFDHQLNTIELKAIKANAMLQMANAKNATRDYEKRLYGEVYRLFVEILVLDFKIKADVGEVRRCCELLEECLDELEKYDQTFGEATYKECLRNLNAILESADSHLDKRIKDKIQAIKVRQEEISYTTLYQNIFNITRAVIEQKENDEKREGDMGQANLNSPAETT